MSFINNFIGKIVEKQMLKGLETSKALHSKLSNKNEINVMLVGTGNPMAQGRGQNATAVFVNGQFLLFDCGDGAQLKMEAFNLPVHKLNAVFLTHFHCDHFSNLGEVIDRSFIQQRRHELEVYGPTGTKQIVEGYLAAYEKEFSYRTAHHGTELMQAQFACATPIEFDEHAEEIVAYEKDGVKVTAFKVNHPPIEPSFGYTIEYKDKKIVISGDTLVTESLKQQSKNADLLVADAMSYEAVRLLESCAKKAGNAFGTKIMHDILEYHMDINDIAKFSTECKVKRLALTHFSPPPPKPFIQKIWFEKPTRQHYKGELFCGDDGLLISIPVN